MSVSLANLLNAIHYPIQQTHHFVAHKSGVVLLDKVATPDSCYGTDSLAFICDLAETFIVAAPSGVGIGHSEHLWSLHCARVYLPS